MDEITIREMTLATAKLKIALRQANLIEASRAAETLTGLVRDAQAQLYGSWAAYELPTGPVYDTPEDEIGPTGFTLTNEFPEYLTFEVPDES